MHKRILRKVKSRAGETIAEVLVALLISSVALVMLASMIASTTNMVTQSKSKMEAYYAANEELEKQISAGNVSFSIRISDEDSSASEPSVNVTIEGLPRFKNDVLGKTVYAYGNTPVNSVGG